MISLSLLRRFFVQNISVLINLHKINDQRTCNIHSDHYWQHFAVITVPFTVITVLATHQWSLYWQDSQMITVLTVITVLARFTNDHCTDNIHGDHWTGIHNDHCADNTLVITVLTTFTVITVLVAFIVITVPVTFTVITILTTFTVITVLTTFTVITELVIFTAITVLPLHSDHCTGNICIHNNICILIVLQAMEREQKGKKGSNFSSPQPNENVSVITGVVFFYLLCVCIMCCKSSFPMLPVSRLFLLLVVTTCDQWQCKGRVAWLWQSFNHF